MVKDRKCCCCIPVYIAVIIILVLYILGLIGVVAYAANLEYMHWTTGIDNVINLAIVVTLSLGICCMQTSICPRMTSFILFCI